MFTKHKLLCFRLVDVAAIYFLFAMISVSSHLSSFLPPSLSFSPTPSYHIELTIGGLFLNYDYYFSISISV